MIAALPVGSFGGSDELVSAVSLDAEAARLASGRGESAHLAMLVDCVADPVHSRIAADGGMVGVDADHLVVLVGSVLVDPVRVQDAKTSALAAHSFLGHRSQIALELELVDALVLRFAEDDTFAVGTLAPAAAHGRAKHAEALLGFESKLVRLVVSRRLRATTDLRLLPVLPGANAHQVSEHVTLLLLPQLLQVFVSAHPLFCSLSLSERIERSDKYTNPSFLKC